jgi:hypothetical protein
VGGDVVPSTDLGSSLGSATKRFKDLYVSSNTIYIGNTTLSVTPGGSLAVGGTSVSSFDGAFSSLTGKPTTVAGYGITDALTSVPAQSFASLTGKPTTISGYGITDAFNGTYSSLTGKPTIPADVADLTDTGGLLGAGGIALTDLSVGAEASASGDGGIAYDNSTGVFTYTPPDLSSYQATLVSGTSIKTINGTSLLGSGNITVSASGADLSAVDENYTPDTDNAYDLGIAAGNFLRSGYFKTSVVIGTGQYSSATLTYNASGQLQSSAGINTSSLYSSSYMSIEPQYGGLIFWMDGSAGGGTLGYSSNNGSNEMTWSGDVYSNGPTYQLDKDKANLQIGAEVTKTISGVTLGATTSLSFSDPHYFNPNSTVTITGVVGTTELNNQTYYIDSSGNLYTDAALTTPLNSSAFTPYVSGGTAVVAPRATMSLPVLHSAPSNPTDGMMAIADGTNWSPLGGSTPGLTIYYNGQWWPGISFVI